MGENKGHQQKGRNFDELSGVGTSSAGITGTTGNLNDNGKDGGVGTPEIADSGNLQKAEHGQPGGTPALGKSERSQPSRQGDDSQGGIQQSDQTGNAGLQHGNT